MKNILTAMFLLLALRLSAAEKVFTLESPDKRITARVYVNKNIQYSLSFKGKEYLLPSAVSMSLAGGTVLGANPVVSASQRRSVQQDIKPLYGISSNIKEAYNELKIDFKGNYSLVFRAYNEGFAYRFITSLPGEIRVKAEQSDYRFPENYTAYFHPALSESDYRVQKVSDKASPNYSSLPLLVKTPQGLNILIHESDVHNYPCQTIFSDSTQANTLRATHSGYPKTVAAGGHMNFNLVVKEQEDFIARTAGKRSFPWRLVAFEEQDKNILTNQLTYLLAEDSKLGDVSWIKPGKVAWDWWNALNLTGVKFKTGFNTETYKYFIDFAAANGIQYVNLDEGWSDQFDLLKTTDKLDMNELVSYARQKRVGLILWCVWRTLDRQMIPALDLFAKWGVAGIKVDFMDRDDQVVVESQERLLMEAAKRKMLVNYHGAYHPTGMVRTYPNNINVEGVKGLEWDKFDKDGASPVNEVSIPFIRMFAGSMDYTPGAMQNYNKADWKQIFDRPMSQGTRCHQLAMYVVYYAPLQMLADAPTAYEREPEVLNFIAAVPTVWDETRALGGTVGSDVSVARRKGTTWYAGSMTGWDEHQADMKLDFLEEGKTYEARIFADGPNAARVGSDYTLVKRTVKKGDVLPVYMAPGGGWAASFTLTGGR